MRSYYEIQNFDAPSPYFFPPHDAWCKCFVWFLGHGGLLSINFGLAGFRYKGCVAVVKVSVRIWPGERNASWERFFFDRRTGGFITAWRTHQPLPTASCLPGTEPLGNTTRTTNVLQRPNHLVDQPWVFVVFVNANIPTTLYSESTQPGNE